MCVAMRRQQVSRSGCRPERQSSPDAAAQRITQAGVGVRWGSDSHTPSDKTVRSHEQRSTLTDAEYTQALTRRWQHVAAHLHHLQSYAADSSNTLGCLTPCAAARSG